MKGKNIPPSPNRFFKNKKLHWYVLRVSWKRSLMAFSDVKGTVLSRPRSAISERQCGRDVNTPLLMVPPINHCQHVSAWKTRQEQCDFHEGILPDRSRQGRPYHSVRAYQDTTKGSHANEEGALQCISLRYRFTQLNNLHFVNIELINPYCHYQLTALKQIIITLFNMKRKN